MPSVLLSPMAPSFRIAIIGGGIGGLCAALSIHHHCSPLNVRLQIDVYEQASQYREIGAGVAIGVNAAKLLHHLGLRENLNAIAGDRNGVWISFRRYDDAAEILTIPADDSKVIRQLSVHRAELLDVLCAAVKERNAAVLHTGKRCESVTQNGNEATAVFQDGTSATADLVVGCDGIHSVVRQSFAADKPVYSGRIAVSAVTGGVYCTTS